MVKTYLFRRYSVFIRSRAHNLTDIASQMNHKRKFVYLWNRKIVV